MNPVRRNSLEQVKRRFFHAPKVHSKNEQLCSGLMKTAMNNVLLPTLFNVVNNIVQYC